jgi:glucose 1-dehydrogenase
MTGVPGQGNNLSVNGDDIMRRIVLYNQVVLGVVNANLSAFRRGVEHLATLCEKFPESMEAIITARVPLESYDDYLMQKQRGEIKTVLSL